MRKIALAAAAALIVVAAPVTAEEEIIPTTPCEESAEATTIGLDGFTEAVEPSAVPSVGTDFDDVVGEPLPPVGYHEESVTRFQYRFDVSGSETVPDATKANLSINLDWDNDGDFDLYVYDAEGNNMAEGQNVFNPVDGAGESVILSNLPHCTDLTIDVVNYLAPGGPLTTMSLSGKVSKPRP
jgi:hypothetical protein